MFLRLPIHLGSSISSPANLFLYLQIYSNLFGKKSLETNKALKEAGNITEVGVKQTEAQLYTAQALLIDINNQIRLLENTISILLGKEPTSIQRTALERQNIETELKTGVPAQLLRNRPDVIQAEYGLVNAFELTNAARANFYPSITLTANGGLQALSAGDLFDTNLAVRVENLAKLVKHYEVTLHTHTLVCLLVRKTPSSRLFP